MFGVECISYLDGDILDADRIDGRRVDDFGTEVTELHSLYVRQFVDGIGRLDDLRISCHETIDICPDFKDLSVEGCGNDSCCIV